MRFNRLTTTTYADSTYELLTLDNNGNVTARQNRAGQSTTYTPDALNRTIQENDPGVSTPITTTYDLLNMPLTVTDASGSFSYVYDTAERLTQITRPDGKVIQHTPDNNGNTVSITYPDSIVYGYAFDELNRMTDVTETLVGGTATNLAHYVYTPLSQPGTLAYANGTGSTYTYDPAHEQLNAITHSFTAGQPQSVTFTYGRDADERRTSDTISTAAFLWHPPAAATTTYTPNTLDQYAEIAALHLGYDTDGNLQSGPVGAPAHTTFDWENRLISTHNGQHLASYAYDALSRRSSTIVDGSATVYVWDGSRIIASYTPGGQELQHYVYGAGSKPILLEVFNGKPLPGQQFWHHTDALGSTVALSNSAGQLRLRSVAS